MKFSIILFSIFLLSSGNIHQDKRLIGTWYTIDKGKMQSVTFRNDDSFDFHLDGLNIDREKLKDIEMTSTFEIVESTINKISLTIRIIHPDTTLTLELKGIYELLNDSTLKLDFRPSDEPMLVEFSSKSIIFTNDLNNLKSKFPIENKEGNYVFTSKKKNEIIQDTIRPSDPRYIGIDTLYKKVMHRKE